jgi:hypothetical protein
VTASVLIGIACLIVLSSWGIAVTVLLSRALSKAFLTIDRMHLRNSQVFESATGKLLNRLMTIKWEDYVTVEAYEKADDEEGGFIPPEGAEPEAVTQVLPVRLRERVYTTPEEQALLDEDFPEVGAK